MIIDNLTLAGLLVVLTYCAMLAVIARRGIAAPQKITVRVRKTATAPASINPAPCVCGASA